MLNDLKLFDITEMTLNNDVCTFLSVLPSTPVEFLQMLGFTGNETAFRITKPSGKHEHSVLTIYFKENDEPRAFSTSWDDKGLQSNLPESQRIKILNILDCVIHDYGVQIVNV